MCEHLCLHDFHGTFARHVFGAAVEKHLSRCHRCCVMHGVDGHTSDDQTQQISSHLLFSSTHACLGRARAADYAGSNAYLDSLFDLPVPGVCIQGCAA
jgi:hypothetical protein